MKINRRRLLKGGTAAAMTPVINLLNSLMSSTVRAQNIGDYKALVCVFLYGGLDNHDTVIPCDPKNYKKWASIRHPLIKRKSNRTLNSLLPLSNSGQSKQFALPPELSELHQLYEQGNAAIVANVGPLTHPTDAQTYLSMPNKRPVRLFSHNDQQSIWMSGKTEGARYGWAGYIMDTAVKQGMTPYSPFNNITSGSAELLLTGEKSHPYRVDGVEAASPSILEATDGDLRTHLMAHFRNANTRYQSPLEHDVAEKMRRSYDANVLFNRASKNLNLRSHFPPSELGQQLKSVAETIAIRDQLGTNRQIFCVELDGFDTHSNQATELPKLQKQISSSLAAFYQSLKELELVEQVTLFTASEFGRTLSVNDDGTDHGWGGHHFVLGGAVKGRQVIGKLPPPEFGHPQDAGEGRLIPTISIEKYVETLAQWFGIEDSELKKILPNVDKFPNLPSLFNT